MLYLLLAYGLVLVGLAGYAGWLASRRREMLARSRDDRS